MNIYAFNQFFLLERDLYQVIPVIPLMVMLSKMISVTIMSAK